MINNWSEEAIINFQQKILQWFEQHQRPLPWRKECTPYHVWISEIMGQQTQIDRVSLYFSRWIKLFPDLPSVAAASEQAVLKAWEGLGYYSRARNIQRAAQQIMAKENGHIPMDYRALLALPGVGPYTAAAILSIAYNRPYPLLDANVERIFARLADIDSPLKQASTKKYLMSLAERLLYRREPRIFNQGLMELGALICTPRIPNCMHCPIRECCLAYTRDTIALRPLPVMRTKRIDISMACAIIWRPGPEFFIQQRLPDDIWGGLWEFPGGRLHEREGTAEGAIREVAEETGWHIDGLSYFATVVHHYTRYRVTLHSFLCQAPEFFGEPVLTAASQCAWVPVMRLSEFPFPAGHRQLVIKLTAGGIPEIY